MSSKAIVFFASMAAESLGIGYMRSILSVAGFKTILIELGSSNSTILRRLKKAEPFLIGFSAIFQFNFDRLANLIGFLRKEGINCHFTAGGHFASLKSEKLFKSIPLLDSIVRFEGEYTILELAECISSGINWRNIAGLVYIQNGRIIKNPLRKVEKDLDKFPIPVRSYFKDFAFNIKYTSILAGRGCVHNCSFCNTREYYRQMCGPAKRIRQPQMVVKEMQYLYYRKSCSIFMFEDDDFPIRSQDNPDWIRSFCSSLKETRLDKNILWKVNCRTDEVDKELFRKMKRSGLFHLFLGIEDGTNVGLQKMNKNATAEINMNSVRIIKKLKIGFDYGFMLFQPDSTYYSINSNLEFLTQICGDGYTPITFQKLLPLYETKVEKDLKNEGRLKGFNGNQDYDFLEKSMNHYYEFIIDIFSEWMTATDGVTNLSKWARDYLAVYNHYFNIISDFPKFKRRIRKYISEGNRYMLSTLKELAIIFESQHYLKEGSLLSEYRERTKSKHEKFRTRLIITMSDFLQEIQFYSFFQS